MNTVNNYQSPNFGMALKIHSAEGLKKYIGGIPERIEEVAKYGAEASKADKKHIRTMQKELKEAGVKEGEIGGLIRYIPETIIFDNGGVAAFAKGVGTSYDSLTNAAEHGCLSERYNEALAYFRNDLKGIIQKREEAAKEARIDKAVEDLFKKYGN